MQQKIKLPSNRNFGIIFSIVFLIISLWPVLSQNDIRIWSLIISGIFLILGLINSKLLLPLNKIWFKFGILLGNFIAPIVMGIVYFMVVTPTGFIMRLLGKDLLNLKKNNKDTYWIQKDNSNSDLKNQF
ncbi:MAG: SxtJ family membrane protein [Candidatus Pelagibacter sp.]